MDRIKKKQKTRETIIAVAKNIFNQKGFEQTTTSEIAEQANIGHGTLFNYFDSKADLLIDVFTEEFIDRIDNLDYHLTEEDQTRCADEIVYLFLYRRINKYLHLRKSMFRDMMGIALTSFQSDQERMKHFIGLDFMLVDELIELLNHLKEEKKLAHDFDSNEAAEIIYSSLAFEFIMFLYQHEMTKEHFLTGIRNKLKFIIH
ncbi:TetR/AcrR family transcriptional regulator [Halobacillus litoralis]|uniref:HTH tetR-type domain-containing protein n=1 Tax=Halobacillus litoralis TaxID=45668 RepID=A0A410MD04_9BACI|nr:TetR/AcrR family transcriptional regulator [Halobacillus litoralis]QAS52556.1 hypothetical protein HLI_10165 [Halobacillus litoralis]